MIMAAARAGGIIANSQNQKDLEVYKYAYYVPTIRFCHPYTRM